MTDLDKLMAERGTITMQMQEAMKNNDTEKYQQAFDSMIQNVSDCVMREARGMAEQLDANVLRARGVRQLTSAEQNYYTEVLAAMKTNNQKQALSEVKVVLPETVIDAVFEDLRDNHPLLSAISFTNAGAAIKYLINTGSPEMAAWGKLCDDIIKELSRGFKEVDMLQSKLSAFLPVCKAMLDLGPAWLDRFVREVLSEALANGLEEGIINGTGVDMPIGMKRDLDAPHSDGEPYAEKTPIEIEDFSPESYGALLAELAQGPNDLTRDIAEVLLIVNPVDYFKKVMGGTAFFSPTGEYLKDLFPFPTKLVRSARVESGKAIIGIAKRYFAALGTAQGGNIEFSDEYRFLEDERVYLVKLYGTGRPLDNSSFLYLNIENVKPLMFAVRTVAAEETPEP